MATPNDQAILNAIINPLLPVEEFKSHSTNEDDDGIVICSCFNILILIFTVSV